jgi:hypothetical protein
VTRTPTGRSALLGVALIMLAYVSAATAAPPNPTRPNDRGGTLGVGATAATATRGGILGVGVSAGTAIHVRPNDRGGILGVRE